MMRQAILLFFLCLSVANAGHSKEEWKSRTIYQLLTDRFASGSSSGCGNLGNYCGGTYQGIINNLDYIQDLGFDAIWITPIVKNYDNGYHGYWATDLYSLNPNFGSEDDFKSLLSACHAKDIWVMVDVVGNHMGGDISKIGSFNPFNQSDHYHDCNGCPSNCQISDYNNPAETEHCRLAGLPDLNQDNSFVRQGLLDWIRWLGSTYDIDGFRVDTLPEVKKSFWSEFQTSASMFAIGEAFNGDPAYVGPFQGGALDSVLSYPMYYTLRDVFGSQKSMTGFQSRLQQYEENFSDPSVLGTFVDNHDNARFLSSQSDYQLYKGALTYVLMGAGIPIVYYGSEQGFAGGNDPNNREPLWSAGFDTSHELYKYIATVNAARAGMDKSSPEVQRYADDSFYAFTRGDVFVALTNVGSSGAGVSRSITYHPYADGTKLCSIFYSSDCITVSGGKFEVYLNSGESKIYIKQ